MLNHVRLEIRGVWVNPLLTDGDEPTGRGAFVAESRSSAHVITSWLPASLLTAVMCDFEPCKGFINVVAATPLF